MVPLSCPKHTKRVRAGSENLLCAISVVRNLKKMAPGSTYRGDTGVLSTLLPGVSQEGVVSLALTDPR